MYHSEKIPRGGLLHKAYRAILPILITVWGTIRELKKGAGRELVGSGATKQIWDDALEFEAYMRSHADLDVYTLQGEVPETMMFGGTSYVIQLCEHGFYDWVMFRDELILYPDKNLLLGRYLGPAINVGPEMTAKIMKAKV